MSDIRPPPAAPTATDASKKVDVPGVGEIPKSTGILAIVFSVIVFIIYGYGAARLSFNTFGSYFWSVVAFLLAPFYYPYFGIFISSPATQPILFGGRRRR